MEWYPWCERAIKDIEKWFDTRVRLDIDENQNILHHTLNGVAKKLSEKKQEVIWQRCGEGKSYKDISRNLKLGYKEVIDIYYDYLVSVANECCGLGLKPRHVYDYVVYCFDSNNSVFCVIEHYKDVHIPERIGKKGTPLWVVLETRNDALGRDILFELNKKRAESIWNELERIDKRLDALEHAVV